MRSLHSYSLLLFFGIVFGCRDASPPKPVASTHHFSISYPLTRSNDTLRSFLHQPLSDTDRINILSALSWNLRNTDPDTAILIAKEALQKADSIAWEKGRAAALNNIGGCFRLLANYDSALIYCRRALRIYTKLGNSTGRSACYGNIGNAFKEQGSYTEALENYLRALYIDDSLKDRTRCAMWFTNIGNVYCDQNDYTKALDYYSRSLSIKEALNNKGGIAMTLGNMAIVYMFQADDPGLTLVPQKEALDKALTYYTKALKIDDSLHNLTGVARHLGNIGIVYRSLGERAILPQEKKEAYQQALTHYQLYLNISRELGDDKEMAGSYGNIGSLQIALGDFRGAFENLYHALAIDHNIGALNEQKEDYELLSSLYESSRVPLPDSVGGRSLPLEEMRIRSIYYYKRYISIRDTLFSRESQKQLLQKEMNYEFDKKEAITKTQNDKKDALAKEQLAQKEKERNYFIAGFALVLLLAGFILKGYRQKQKANNIISHQKAVVEEKQKEILDSIHYAKRIQQSLLPSEKYIIKTLNRLKQ